MRVVFLGYLFPFGNRAVRIVITDREFQTDRAGATIAYLIRREYIVVTEPIINFTGDPHEPNGGRGNPIRRVEVKTVTTPPLEFDAPSMISPYTVAPLLGVVVQHPVPPGAAFPQDLLPYVSGYGQDPVFTAGAVRQASVTDFSLATHRGTRLLLAEQNQTQPFVDVAGHAVSWDASRKLWFADIALNPGETYFPFVKLALVRYQPNSLAGLELSRVVQTDFIQVAPNRTMQLTFPSPTEVAVVVTGPGYLGTTDPSTPDAVRAYVQEKTVKLPAKRGSKPLRILVAEFEQHKVVRVGNLPNRVSYLDAIQI